MIKNVIYMFFCLKVFFLFYLDWNMEIYGENLDMIFVDVNIFVERLLYFYIVVRFKINVENNGKD